MSGESRFFITPEALFEAIGENGENNVKIVDGSWYLPAMERDGEAEYRAARIPGAVYFDIDRIADPDTDLPHMLPAPEIFAKAVSGLGISNGDTIIVYDGPGLFSAARVWWSFKVMGAADVRVLAGGFDGWKAAGLPVETGAPKPITPAHFEPAFKAAAVRDFDYMLGNLKKGETLVLDARPFPRFTGEAPEPRAGLRSGHMPGSRSLPAADLVRDGKLLPITALRAHFAERGVSADRHVTTTCGSGVTAAILSLALEAIGHDNHSLYDGSWAEWGARPDAVVARWE